jgi:hypothetical protein
MLHPTYCSGGQGHVSINLKAPASWDDLLNPAFHGLTADDFEVIQLGWRPVQPSAPSLPRIIK